MAKKFQLIDKFLGYNTLSDRTHLDPRFLVSGSQNVLINDSEKISIRGGYTVLGAENTALNPVESSFDWNTSSATERNLRSYDDELEVYVGTVGTRAFNAWHKLKDAWDDVDFVFTTWWSAAELIDVLLFVVGTANIYEWSGALTTYASATTNTITKEGTNTWAQDRFLTAGTRQIRIRDSGGTWRTFTYTGGESTTTLTGVTPDPTAFTFDAGALVMQEVRTNANQPASGFLNDFISVAENQVWVGSNTSRRIYVSKNSSITDYTFSSPRVAGEGALLTLDSYGVGFAPQEDAMYVTAGKDDWYKSEFEQITVSTTLAETLKIKKLKTAPGQAARSHDFITKIGNYVAFLTNEPALRLLGRVENIENPQLTAISNPIKPDFDAETWTNGHILFHKNRIYLSAPTNSKVYINQIIEDDQGNVKRFWQAPQILPARRFSNIAGDLHFHSNAVPETYVAFDGTNDNENSINAIAKFAYNSYGDRVTQKAFDEYFTEGYISSNTTLTLTLNYDFDGFTQSIEKEIDGNDADILFEVSQDDSLGNNPLGDVSLGGSGEAGSNQLSKFRIIHGIPKTDFWEIQAVYSTDGVDQQFEILAQGPNATLATNIPISIMK